MNGTSGLGFFDAGRIAERYSPNLALARAEGRKLGLAPARAQIKAGNRHTLVLIDEELDFADDGRLPVKGMYADVARLIGRIVKGTENEVYTDLIVTIDVHPPHTIHSDSWWMDDHGAHPYVTLPVWMELVDPADPYPFLGHFVDGSTKQYKPRLMPKWTVEQYAPYLAAKGQYIWVWPDHCRECTDGVNLVPALAEAIEWMCAARDIQPVYMYKGMISEVDWFGPFRPTMDVPTHPQGGLQAQYLDIIRESHRTEIAGEAEDFCVKAGMSQVLEYYESDPATLAGIGFLETCTSPIFPDDPASGKTPNADFKAEMAAKGVKMLKHDSPLNW